MDFKDFLKRPVFWVNTLTLTFFILDRTLRKIALSGTVKKFLFFKLFLFKNSGIALSLSFRGLFFYFLLVIVFYIVVFSLIKSYREGNKINILCFNLIFIGASSNLLDRLKYGWVIDYFNCSFFSSVFNIADLMILSGTIILIGKIFLDPYRVKRFLIGW